MHRPQLACFASRYRRNSPTLVNSASSLPANSIPNASSMANIRLTCSSESHAGMSRAVVASVSASDSSSNTVRNTCWSRSCTVCPVPLISDLDVLRLRVVGPAEIVSPPRRPAFPASALESQARVEIAHQFVLRRRNVRPGDGIITERARSAEHLGQHHLFDRTADHPAAHEPGVDIQAFPVRDGDQHGDEAVIGESVPKPQGEGNTAGSLREGAELGKPVTASGEIELVSLADELLDAGQVELVQGPYRGTHAEAPQKLLHGSRLRFECGGFRTRLVLARARGVLGGECRGLQQQVTRERTGVVRGILREAEDIDLRERGPHRLALGGIVIDEDERIQSDPEVARDGAEAVRLGIPAGGEAGDVVEPEPHVRMLLERLSRVSRIVFRN